MGVKWSRSALQADMRALAGAEKEFKEMVQDEFRAIAPTIEQAMHFYSDLQKDRITGNMIRDMKVRVAGLQLRMGFLDGYQDYYTYQTITGFTHWQSGKFIAPSLAIADAKLDADTLVDEAARRIRRNFLARLRRRG